MEDWALIRRLHGSEGMSKAQIARQLGLSRNTVAKAVTSSEPPQYERARSADSAWSVAELSVRAVAVEVSVDVGDGDRRADRLVHLPGEQVQCDLMFPGALVPDHGGVLRSFPVLVMVATYSRFIAAVMLPSRVTGDLLAGMWVLISESFGVVYGTLATTLIQAPPYDPEAKGVVKRANEYLRSSFLPGRTFNSPTDFNTQLDECHTVANTRTHRVARARPVDGLVGDQAAMAPLPPVGPAVGSTDTTRLGRDYYVHVGGSAYSVHPDGIGRLVTVTSSLDWVRVFCDHRLLADHDRAWGTHAVVTDPTHVEAAKQQRKQYNSARRDAKTGDGGVWKLLISARTTPCSRPGRSRDGHPISGHAGPRVRPINLLPITPAR